MILGVGIDVVHVNRMKRWRDVPGLFQRFFNPTELEDAQLRKSSEVLSLAARFAAKEAFGKALGTGLRGLALKDVLVRNNHNGKPEIRLFDKAAAALDQMGGKKVFVSLTHEKDNAIAIVVIEGE